MAFDEVLADRIHEHFAGTGTAVQPRRMFGGIVYMIDGNMTVGVMGDDMMARIGEDAVPAALANTGVGRMRMQDRPMKAWIVVDGTALDDDVMARWIAAARAFVATLPPK